MGEKSSKDGNEEYQRTCEACKRRYIMTFNAREKTSHCFFMQANIGISQYCLSVLSGLSDKHYAAVLLNTNRAQ